MDKGKTKMIQETETKQKPARMVSLVSSAQLPGSFSAHKTGRFSPVFPTISLGFWGGFV
jgi:hypothetical protein